MNKLRALCDRVGSEPHMWSVLGVLEELGAILAQGEPDEAALERAGRELAALEVPQADWFEDFTDNERADYRRCAGDILRAALEG